MVGYVKGTTPDGEMARVREAFALATTAIQAWPDPREAQAAADQLVEMARNLQKEAADFRGYLAAYLMDAHGMTITELAAFLGVSRPRASQIISAARERGTPVTEPTTLPEQKHVVLAIITSGHNVLIEKRRDGIPPYSFPGGEIEHDETYAQAAKRRVLAETGVNITTTTLIGRRLHPKTSRVVVYAHATVDSTDVHLGDPEDLAEVRWASIDETRELMPDMFGTVRQYLDELQRAS
jgi:8-oxo-dGTP diphosphatase